MEETEDLHNVLFNAKGMCMLRWVCGGQRTTYSNQFVLPTMWALSIKLMSWGMATSTFTQLRYLISPTKYLCVHTLVYIHINVCIRVDVHAHVGNGLSGVFLDHSPLFRWFWMYVCAQTHLHPCAGSRNHLPSPTYTILLGTSRTFKSEHEKMTYRKLS